MSTDPVLATILSALDDLKKEVAGLTSRLHSAEGRITRIEEATFTPSASSSSSPNAAEKHESGSISVIELTEKVDVGQGFGITPSGECSCEIRHQLRPVHDTLAAMTVQLSRIERAISVTTPSRHSPPAKSANSSHQACNSRREEPAPRYNTEPPNTPPKDPPANPTKASKLRYSFTPHGDPLASPQNVRPVFGHPSTPSRRIVSLDVTKSPFGNYSDERSPFSRLELKSGGDAWRIKTPQLSKLSGLSSNFSIAFGASGPTTTG